MSGMYQTDGWLPHVRHLHPCRQTLFPARPPTVHRGRWLLPDELLCEGWIHFHQDISPSISQHPTAGSGLQTDWRLLLRTAIFRSRGHLRSALLWAYLYGDNVIEKHGINRDRTGDREKTRYLCGKQGIFTRDRALIRPGSIRQLETRASTRSASFFHALGGPGRPYNGGGAAGAYCTHNGAKPLKQGHLRAKRGPLGPSRKSQQQTKRTGFAAHGHSIAETASEGKRASRANGALNRAKINGRGQKQGFGGVDRRRGGVTSCYSRRYDDGGDRAITGGKCGKAILHFPHSRVEL